MSKYAGISCPVCGGDFKDSDDIVVCPDCGAPHHRACYKELGSCVFAARHEPGFIWKGPAPHPAQEENTPASASAAGAVLPPPFLGTPPPDTQGTPDYRRNFGQTGPDPNQNSGGQGFAGARIPFDIHLEEEIDHVPIKDVAQFIGTGVYYYLPRFQALAKGAASIIPNLSAIVFGFFYYFNRKMYALGAAFFAFFLLSVAPTLLLVYYKFPEVMAAMPQFTATGQLPVISYAGHEGLLLLGNFFSMAYCVTCIFSGFFANKLYYNFAMKRIHSTQAAFQGRPDQEYAQALSIQGRTNKIAVVAVIASMIMGYMVYVAFLVSAFGTIG